MIRYTLLATGLFFLSIQLSAQSLSFDFPHFAGQEYHFWAFRGDEKDTIASGKLNEQGKGRLVLPDRLKGHRGMTQWMLTKGGGLDIIFAGEENFSVSCAEAQPSDENIIYTGSRENVYLDRRFQHQQAILGKIDAMRMAVEAYKDNNRLLDLFNTELRKQEQAYNLLQEETAREPLYAARFAQVVDISRGFPPVLSSNYQERDRLLKDFVLKELDINALYTSGHWSGILDQFLGWYTHSEADKPMFIADMTRVFNRIPSDEVYTALSEKIIVFCEKNDWYDQQVEFALFLLNDDRIREPAGKIASIYTLFKLSKGSKAPGLSQGALPEGNSILLVFYESGCGPCENEMQHLKDSYSLLRGKGYEVVSVSADTDEDIFRNMAETFPWKDKYCDFRGFSGTDFESYGVMGTPTFFVIDKDGTIRGRYASLENVLQQK